MTLNNFIDKIVSKETDSYYTNTNLFEGNYNGAMKVLTGLDWLDSQIHYPEKLIDYCINNKPLMEVVTLLTIFMFCLMF